MANWYVRSAGTASGARGACGWNASNAANGTIYATVAACLAASPAPAAGDIICVADDHQETTAGGLTYTLPGTLSAPNYILSCDYTAAAPQNALYAQSASSGSINASSTIIFAGSLFAYGLVLEASAGWTIANANDNHQAYTACNFVTTGSGTGPRFTVGTATTADAVIVTFTGCNWTFANAAQGIRLENGRISITGGSIGASGTAITNVFLGGSGLAFVECRGVDLSAVTGAIVADYDAVHLFQFINCKPPSSVTWNAASAASHPRVDTFDCDSAGTNYVSGRFSGNGLHQIDTTHYRTGGCSIEGTPLGWNVTTPASLTSWVFPFESQPLCVMCDSTGSHSVSLYLLGPSGLNNDDVWIEVIYNGSSSSSIGTVDTSTTKSNVTAANAALTTDPAGTASWNSTSGITGPTAYKITTGTLSIAQKGIIQVRLKVAKPGLTIYVDPAVVLN